MEQNEKTLREEIGSLYKQMKAISSKAEAEGRDMTDEEVNNHADLHKKAKAKVAQVEAMQAENELESFRDNAVEMTGDVPEPKANVVDNADPKDRAFHHTADIFRALANKDKTQSERDKVIHGAQRKLFEAGEYPMFKASADAFSTLTDDAGGVFLPQTVMDRILQIDREYGAFSQDAEMIPLQVGGGRQVLPNLLGEITFHAVNEGSSAKASRFSFSGLALEDLKWMGYIPWTYKIDQSQGARMTELITQKLGEARARTRDDVVINGDGTSEFHRKRGIIHRAGNSDFDEVRRTTAASGHDDFDSIDISDLLKAQLDVAPSIRGRGVYVMHPDWRVKLANMKDNEDRPYYLTGGPIAMNNGEWTIFGRPVRFTEKMPNEDGASKEYAIFYVPEYLGFGDVGAMSTEQMNEATIPDSDGKNINLGAQDIRALKARMFFDFELSQLTVDDNGTHLGAFTVLRTAS